MIDIKTIKKERKSIENALYNTMSQFLTIDLFKQFKELVESMDDETFANECIGIVNMYDQQYNYADMTQDKIFDNIIKIREKLGVTPENSAMQLMELEVLPIDEVHKILNILDKSRLTDIVKLTGKQDQELQKIWMTPEEIEKPYNIIPSDLFFSKTIPILDIKIIVDESDVFPNRPKKASLCTYRVVILHNYDNIVDELNINESGIVGYILMEVPILIDQDIKHIRGVAPIVVIKGSNMTTISNKIGFDVDEEKLNLFKKSFRQSNFIEYAAQLLITWYSIQIALLHPTVCELFKKPRIEKLIHSKSNNTNKNNVKKRPVKYVKVHTINTDEYEKALYGENKPKGKHNMTKLSWYVIGHWRNYKNGKKIFIKPFWKGPLRHMKQACEDNIKERVIYTSENEKETIAKNILKDRR